MASSHWLSPEERRPWRESLSAGQFPSLTDRQETWAATLTGVAGFPFPPIFAVTVKVIDQVSTCTPIVARVLATVIYVVFTVRALPAVTTDTLVGVNTVDACATVFTGVALTVVDIFMAVGAGEAFVTVTGEFASRLALALPMGTTDVRRDIPHPFRRIVGSHGHSAAVNHFTGSGTAVVFQV